MLLWSIIGFVAFIVFVRTAKKIIFSEKKYDINKDGVLTEMQKEVAHAMREKAEAFNIISTDEPLEDSPEKILRRIQIQLRGDENLDDCMAVITRDILRWYNQVGYRCGKVIVSSAIPPELISPFESYFNEKLLGHPRIKEMQQMGCEVILEPEILSK